VIHGEKDYRVIGEALRLWYELLTDSGLSAAEDAPAPTDSSISRRRTTGC
jgi:hypothetical protein